METFLNHLKSNFLDKHNKISASRMLQFFKNNPDAKNKLIQLTQKCEGTSNFAERIFWLENSLDDYLICSNPKCGNQLIGVTRWQDSKYLNHSKYEYFMCCSNKCKHQLHSIRTDSVHPKRVKTFQDKYGITNSAHLDSNVFKSNNPMKNKKSIDKMKQTCIEKYGVDNPSKSTEIMNKIIKQGYRSKDYIFPSGKVVRIRGYEWKALDELLQHYNETDIEVSAKRIPKIRYCWEDGTEHYYFPDIYIQKDNLVIEVKSDYFMRKDFDKNNRKAVATKNLGYNFKFMVYSS